ncbi:MAG: hypothetical protein HZC38_00030 [Chloroflexi bacterium]|nr:hypothetical protein [Chloroflexota bacterium]MBI5711804.1 hypothetical protein [Chloroflexota bacterium]
MEVLLLTILGDIIAGVAVHGIIEGFSKSGGNQTVNIENAFFNVPELRFSSGSSGSSSSNGDKIWILFFGILIIFAMIVVFLVGLSAIYVQNINLILGISFWVTIIMSVIGGVLLVVGLLYKDWSVAQVAFYSLILCTAVGGLVWLIYAPPNAPAGYKEVFVALQNLNLHDSTWTSKAIEIGMGDEFLTINPAIKFIALQAFGILPMLITVILVIYIQASLAKAVLLKESGNFSIYCLGGAPILATISALCLGVFR